MKVAVPDWQGRVSPVFDVAEQVLLVDLNDDEDGSQHTESLGSPSLQQRAQRLAELRVDVLLCGAISWPLGGPPGRQRHPSHPTDLRRRGGGCAGLPGWDAEGRTLCHARLLPEEAADAQSPPPGGRWPDN